MKLSEITEHPPVFNLGDTVSYCGSLFKSGRKVYYKGKPFKVCGVCVCENSISLYAETNYGKDEFHWAYKCFNDNGEFYLADEWELEPFQVKQ